MAALSGAVTKVLLNFGVEEASCGRDSVGEFVATTRDLTVVMNSRGKLGTAIVFGFDSGVAQALAGKISAFMFGEALAVPASQGPLPTGGLAAKPAPGRASTDGPGRSSYQRRPPETPPATSAPSGLRSRGCFGGVGLGCTAPIEEDEYVRGALGEMVSYALLATLNALGLPPEFAVPRFVQGRGVRLAASPQAARSFSVTTESGEFEVGFVPGVSLSQGAGPAQRAGPYRRRIVVADDSAVVRKTIELALTRAGYEVAAHARDGREAVEEFRRRRPDLVVLDLNMPVMGGLDALKIIRAEDPSACVLICSAIADTGTIHRALKSGATGYITKPFDPAKLVEMIEDMAAASSGPRRRPDQASSPVRSKSPTRVVKTAHSNDALVNGRAACESATSRTVGGRLSNTPYGDGAGTPQGEPPSPADTYGTYRVSRLIAEGGMAAVYEGYDPGLGRKVALKVILERYATDVDFVVRFLEEARAVAKVNDPNVVSVYFAGSDRGKHFFAMELLPGPDLGELAWQQGGLPRKEALSYLRQGALGLAAARRQGLIHCDVKPSNLVFGSDGLVKVTDFGIVQRLGTKDNPTISESVGTPWFMSPERVLEEPIDHRSDIYSLGATLYYLLTGELPYDESDATEIALRQVHDPAPRLPSGPRKLNRLLGRMMAKTPQARHADYDELLKDIGRLL